MVRATRAMRSSARAERWPRAAAMRSNSSASPSRAPEASHVAPGDGGIGGVAGSAVARVLQRPSRFDASADRRRRFARGAREHLVELHARDVDVQVDAVEERPRELGDVLGDGGVVAAAIARAHAAKAAGARVHRGDQREACGIGEGAGGARDRDGPLLERLAHHFERRARELRQLVEEEHAVLREADLARVRGRAAAAQRDLGRIIFEAEKITRAISKAFLAVGDNDLEKVRKITQQVNDILEITCRGLKESRMWKKCNWWKNC